MNEKPKSQAEIKKLLEKQLKDQLAKQQAYLKSKKRKPPGKLWRLLFPLRSRIHGEEGVISSAEIEFMPDVEKAARASGHNFAFLLSLTIGAFLTIFIIWAKNAPIDEVTRGDAKVIPSSKVQTIQNLEGGIVSGIRVREGDIVEKGTILVRIDNTTAEAQLRENSLRILRFKARKARLEAEIQSKALSFPPELLEKLPGAAQDELSLYELRKDEQRSKIASLIEQREQRQYEITNLQRQSKQLERELELVREELQLSESLFKKGLVPKVDFIRITRDEAQTSGNLENIRLSIPKARSALKEVNKKIEEAEINFKTAASRELIKIKDDLSSLEESFKIGIDRVTRTAVKSPVRGIVQEIFFTTIGGVIAPGEKILNIIPLEDTLLLEARIRPKDIAFLRPGQEAVIKITAYDFSIYGGFKGSVENISADSITDERGNSFFRVYLRTKENKLQYKGEDLSIIPGMTASVDILTGSKTILDYIMKPILKSQQNALRER